MLAKVASSNSRDIIESVLDLLPKVKQVAPLVRTEVTARPGVLLLQDIAHLDLGGVIQVLDDVHWSCSRGGEKKVGGGGGGE